MAVRLMITECFLIRKRQILKLAILSFGINSLNQYINYGKSFISKIFFFYLPNGLSAQYSFPTFKAIFALGTTGTFNLRNGRSLFWERIPPSRRQTLSALSQLQALGRKKKTELKYNNGNRFLIFFFYSDYKSFWFVQYSRVSPLHLNKKENYWSM